MGSIRNRKTEAKNHPKPQKNSIKPKTVCKTITTDNFSHPSYENPDRTVTEVTSEAKRGFASV